MTEHVLIRDLTQLIEEPAEYTYHQVLMLRAQALLGQPIDPLLERRYGEYARRHMEPITVDLFRRTVSHPKLETAEQQAERPLPPTQLNYLAYFQDHRLQPITNEELIKNVHEWTAEDVASGSPTIVTTTIKLLRKTLKDSEERLLVGTLKSIGYAFLSEVLYKYDGHSAMTAIGKPNPDEIGTLDLATLHYQTDTQHRVKLGVDMVLIMATYAHYFGTFLTIADLVDLQPDATKKNTFSVKLKSINDRIAEKDMPSPFTGVQGERNRQLRGPIGLTVRGKRLTMAA